MNQHFPVLFSPIILRSFKLANRFVNTGHATEFADGARFSERHLHYYRERAKGGAAMIVTEAVSIHPTGGAALQLHDDASVPMLGRIADAVHEFDVPIVVQLTHAGRRMPSPTGMLDKIAVGPSPIPAPSLHFGQMMPHELSTAEVEELVQAFGDAANRSTEARLDGVELSIAFGNLVPQFLAAASNVRTDKYGGATLKDRMTFVYEVIDAIRSAIGSDRVLGARLTEDFLDYGISIDDIKVISALLEDTGDIDYISVSAGTNYDLDSAANIIPSHYFKPGQFAGLAADIKKLVSLPVIGAGRINSPELAESLLVDGQMDLIGMARELIADPYFPSKARDGRAIDIRSCVACNQTCKGHQAVGLPIGCVYNPVAGREGDWSELAKASESKNVAIIGGGPAGLEAARVAALRGHNVTIYEASSRLGGQINIAMKAPNRQEWGNIVSFYERQIASLDVKVKFGETATEESILSDKPDAVIVATGSAPFVPTMPGSESAQVVSARDVLSEKVGTGDNVVVIDTQGLRLGCDVANFLVSRSKQVEIVTGMPYVGQHIQAGVWRHLYQELMAKGVRMTPFTGVRQITEGAVHTYSSVYDHETTARVIEGVDTVVFASGGIAESSLFNALSDKMDNVYAIGDCAQPRTVEAAVYEGHKVARLI